MGRKGEDSMPPSGDRRQSHLALRAAADRFTEMLSEAIAECRQGQYVFRVKVDRGKVKELQLTGTTDEPTEGFDA
jgi:hypothetical protein